MPGVAKPFPGRFATFGIFAAALGYAEAVVVVYIRALMGIGPGQGESHPAELLRRSASMPWLVPTEQTREAATLVILGCVAWLGSAGWQGRLGAFLYVFGIWDLTYYLGLYMHLQWPTSLTTMDLLFLIPPGPWWYQPVWLPMVIAAAFIVVGSLMLAREHRARPLRDTPRPPLAGSS